MWLLKKRRPRVLLNISIVAISVGLPVAVNNPVAASHVGFQHICAIQHFCVEGSNKRTDGGHGRRKDFCQGGGSKVVKFVFSPRNWKTTFFANNFKMQGVAKASPAPPSDTHDGGNSSNDLEFFNNRSFRGSFSYLGK